MAINPATTDVELAVLVSQALESAGIIATLAGGAAVSIYSKNEYKSLDLDFVTAAMRNSLMAALEPLGFVLAQDKRHFEHADTAYFLEFPPAPLEFGNRTFEHQDVPMLETPWGLLRVITPTMCVMDRLLAYWHGTTGSPGIRQSW